MAVLVILLGRNVSLSPTKRAGRSAEYNHAQGVRQGLDSLPALLADGASRWVEKYQGPTPAMALGLTTHVFTVKEILLTPVFPLQV